MPRKFITAITVETTTMPEMESDRRERLKLNFLSSRNKEKNVQEGQVFQNPHGADFKQSHTQCNRK